MRAADVDLEAVVFGQVSRAAQMPLADVPGLVATPVERPRQRVFLLRQMLEIGHVDDPAAGRVQVPVRVDPVGDADRGWVLAGEDAGAGRRTDRAGGVGVAKAHALCGQPVDIGRLVKGAAVADQIPPTHIVDENKDDIGSRHDRASSIAAMSAGSSGAVLGSKRASGVPSLATRNFSKFQVISPGNAAASPLSAV